jgi:hypothetical protein
MALFCFPAAAPVVTVVGECECHRDS